MRTMLAIVLATVMSLSLGEVVAAHPTCPVEQTIASVRTCIEHALQEGAIDDGVARSLLALLDAAQAALDRGQVRVAVQLLVALQTEVRAQAGHLIDPMHAEHLLHHVDLVIESLTA